jgi:hypothetical protein
MTGFVIYGMPRHRLAFVVGGLSLIFIILRASISTVAIYKLIPRLGGRLWVSCGWNLLVILLLVRLTLRFICGAPSRAYYRID